MSSEAAQSAVVRKLARGSLLSRLTGSRRQPLRLVAVPRDHVQGDRGKGDAVLAGRFLCGTEQLPLADLDFGAVGADGPLAEQLQGFSWLRDLAAAASRERASACSACRSFLLAERASMCSALPTVVAGVVFVSLVMGDP